jgi:hypothetical protein
MVQQRLASDYDISRTLPVTTLDAGLTVDPAALGPAQVFPRYLFAFDGSPHESIVRPQYPSTRVVFVQVAGVLTNLSEMLAQEPAQFVDPSAVKAATDTAILSMVFPGSNVVRRGCRDVQESWREELFVSFREREIEGRSLLHVYMTVASHSDKSADAGKAVVIERCPNCRGDGAFAVPIAGLRCHACNSMIYPTDALRVHEEVSEEHSNMTPVGRVMTVAEHLAAVAYAEFFHQRQATTLSDVAFILDGPLALFGPQAWLRAAVFRYYTDLRDQLQREGLRGPLLIGIEKSGQFVEHAEALGDLLQPGRLMRLPSQYIYNHVKASQPETRDKPFGRDEYYGQKFIYRSARGQVLVFTILKSDLNQWIDDPAQYEDLPRVIALLERIETALYPNAVIPVALAHHFASIPLRTGERVLTLLAQERLGLR